LAEAKCGYAQKVIWRKSFNAFSTSWKLAVECRLLLRFHELVPVAQEQHAYYHSR